MRTSASCAAYAGTPRNADGPGQRDEQYEQSVRPMHLDFVEPSKRWRISSCPRSGKPQALEMITHHILGRFNRCRRRTKMRLLASIQKVLIQALHGSKGLSTRQDSRLFKQMVACALRPYRKEHAFYRLQGPDWVNVIAFSQDLELVVVEQYRHGSTKPPSKSRGLLRSR